MSDYLTISLSNLRFRAHHGLYAEERKTGNEFGVNLSVEYQPASGTVTDLSDTVNYEKLYQLLKAEMQKPRDLLETFVMEVAELIHLSFPLVQKVEIAITKLHPPIAGFEGEVTVQYSRQY